MAQIIIRPPIASTASVAATLAAGKTGTPVAVSGHVVDTKAGYYLADDVATIVRSPDSPVEIPEDASRVRLQGLAADSFAQLIASSAASGSQTPNAAKVAVEGMLQLQPEPTIQLQRIENVS